MIAERVASKDWRDILGWLKNLPILIQSPDCPSRFLLVKAEVLFA
jgi:hypothetical protein